MTMFQRSKVRQELEKQNAKLDKAADEMMEEAQGSKFTGLMLAGAAILIACGLLWVVFG